MKVAHITDIHVQAAPSARELMRFKRILGTTNLYVFGRKSKFDPIAQQAAIRLVLNQEPDLVIFTGDLTAQALEGEFKAARTLLDPILSNIPTVLIAGNHDAYVHEPSVGHTMRQHFGPWMGDGIPHLFDFGEVAVLTLETCRPHPLSAGFTPPEQIERAKGLLGKVEPAPFLFLAIHYPLRNRHGGDYGPSTRALSNAADVEAFIQGQSRIGAVLHGHEHHGFQTTIATAKGPIPILNPGASGYARIVDTDRTAHVNVYDVDSGGINDVQRFRFNGRDFEPEPGGPYATGR